MIHLIKLSVGSASIDDIAAWQASSAVQIGGYPAHVTRMRPKRTEELLAGGSLYWVIQGMIQARQKLRALHEVQGDDGIKRCAIVLERALIPVAPAPRRPFQGWRYLEPNDTPPDLAPQSGTDSELPAELRARLAEIGVL